VTPTLVVVSGPAGSGKTTLAYELGAAMGCPVISRDEIKQGMARATPGFTGAPGDELTRRTFPVFFAVLELLLRSGVTTVADAAFQDHVWRPELAKLQSLAEIRVVHCTVAADVAFARIARREQDDPQRRVHAAPGDPAGHEAAHRAFRRVSIAAPALEVDTSDGYRPPFGQILSFATGELYPERAEVSRPAAAYRCSGSGPRAARPPSTGSTAPVTKLACSDSR